MSKRAVGRRCMVGKCNNVAGIGEFGREFSIFQAPPATRKLWVKFLLRTRKSTFDDEAMQNVHICSGHFVKSDFVQSQIVPFTLGHRKAAPQLVSGSVPSIKTAVPFSVMLGFEKTRDQFCKSPIKIDTLNLPQHRSRSTSCTSTSAWSVSTTTSCTTATCSTTMTTSTPVSSSTSSQFLSTMTSTSSTSRFVRPVCTATLYNTSTMPMMPASSKDRAKRLAAISRRKLVDDIVGEYEREVKKKKLEESLAMFPNSGTQTDAKMGMINRKLQIGKSQVNLKQKHCGLQCKPFKKTQETQTGTCTSLQLNLVHVTAEVHVQTDPVIICDDKALDDEDGFDDITGQTNTDKDPDYEPSSESSPSDSESDSDYEDATKNTINRSHENIISETKYIVFESELLKLFRWCPKCNMPCSAKKSTPKCFGSMVRVHQECTGCNFERSWDSQPRINSVWAGNILLSSAILYAGASPSAVLRVFKHLNLQSISYSTFMEHQNVYLQPAIVVRYRTQQQQILQQIRRSGVPVVLGGDARCDSPGHSAKFGSYTLMDLNTSKIVDLQLVQSNETTSSNAMELEGLKRGIAHLRQNQVTISTLVTDRHISVNAHIRDKEPDITHYFDVWHVGKGLKKQLSAAQKLKQCEVIGDWKQSIVNHLYWTASSTPDANSDVMVAKFTSILNHVKNVHEGHSEHFNNCAHGELEPREWIAEDSKAYDKLQEIITRPYLLKDIKKLSPVKQTSKVEAYHGVILYFAPKLLTFSYEGMKCRLYLSALHWNENGNRPQAVTKDGSKQYTISFPKAKAGGCVVKKTLVKCTYNYVSDLMTQTVDLVATGQRTLYKEMPELQAPDHLCSQYERPNKVDAIAAKEALQRFARSFDEAVDETV